MAKKRGGETAPTRKKKKGDQIIRLFCAPERRDRARMWKEKKSLFIEIPMAGKKAANEVTHRIP